MQQGRPGAEGGSMQPGRPGAGAGPAMQQRPGAGAQPGRPGGVPSQAPANQPPTDNRSWADRAHALGQPSLPPSQQPRSEPPPQMREGGDSSPSQGRFVPNGSPREFNSPQTPGAGRSFRDERPPVTTQPERPEPARPPMNNFNRPQQMDRAPPRFENRGSEERRPAEAAAPRFANPPPAPVPNNRFANPPPAPVPSNRGFAAPPPAPVPSAPVQPRMAPPPPPPPQQRQQAPAREERGSPPQQRGGQRGDPRRN
jgi:hypothetical protein